MEFKVFSFLSSLILFHYSSSLWAIKGEYLPESEYPLGICKLVAFDVETTYTPIDDQNKPTGEPAFKHRSGEEFFCTASVIDNDRFLTAAHCFQGNNEQRRQKGTMPFPQLVSVKDEAGRLHWEMPKGCQLIDLQKKGHPCVAGLRRVESLRN